MDIEGKYAELVLTSDEPDKEEYIHMVMDLDDYLRYDDNDLYSENYFLEEEWGK